MALETVCLEHIPSAHSVHVAFFRNVSNPDFLQSQLVARNPDFEYAFIDASSVVSRVQVLAATFKALTLLLSGSLRTPNVHSEIVCSLSPTNNVGFVAVPFSTSKADSDLLRRLLKLTAATELPLRPRMPSLSKSSSPPRPTLSRRHPSLSGRTFRSTSRAAPSPSWTRTLQQLRTWPRCANITS